MAKVLVTENMVKKALNIDSFRNLSKSKVIEFVSLLPQMNTEVATAIINQFPRYSQTATEMVKHLKEVCKTVVDSNDANTKSVFEAYQKILDTLSTMLQNDDLTFSEKQQITASMVNVADKMAEKDSENKHFLQTIQKVAVGAAIGLAALLGSVLGLKIMGFKLPQLSS